MAKKKATKGEMRITLENSKILKTLIETLSSIYDEVKFEIDESGLFTNLMDPSRICMARAVLKSNCFDAYEVSGTHYVSINLDDFNKILKRSNNDIVELSHDSAALKLRIKFTQPDKERGRNFTLSESDLDIEDVPMTTLLEIQYPTKIVIDPDQLKSVLQDADIYSECIDVELNELLEFKAEGNIGNYSFESELDDLLESTIEEYSSGMFSISFLKNILKLIPITEKLEISLKTGHPLKIVFELLEGGKLFYFLAPRTSEVDFDDEDEMEDH